MTCSHGCCETQGEHYRSINLSPAATPTKTFKAGKPKEPKNSWERGIARDHRGMPMLDHAGEPMGIKAGAEVRRSFTESLRKEQTSKE